MCPSSTYECRTGFSSLGLFFYLFYLPLTIQARDVSTCSPYFHVISTDHYSDNQYIEPCPVSKPCTCICQTTTKHLWIDCFYRQLKIFPHFKELSINDNRTRFEWSIDLAFNNFQIKTREDQTNWLPKDMHLRHLIFSGSLGYDLISQLPLTHRHLIDEWPSKTHFSNDQQFIDEKLAETHQRIQVLEELTNKLRNRTQRLKSFTLTLAGEPGPVSSLYLDHNALDSIPSSALYNATTIQEIYLSFNQIVELPAYAFGFSHRLTRIDLSHNIIRTINSGSFQRHPSAFAGPFLIDYLDLSHNRLSVLDNDIFSYLVNLRLLKLEHNQIHSITAHAWTGLYRLKFLDLSHNRLENFSQIFYSGYLNELTQLKVTSNNINELNACDFLTLKGLTKLNLNNNNITSIDSCAFYGLRQISTSDMPLHVFLLSNALETVDPCSFDKFARSTIHIDNNPLMCNCSFNYLLYERQSLAYTGRECRGGFDYPIQYQPNLPAVRKMDGFQRKKSFNFSHTCQLYYQQYKNMCSQLDCSSICIPHETFIIQVTTIETPSRANFKYHRQCSTCFLSFVISFVCLSRTYI